MAAVIAAAGCNGGQAGDSCGGSDDCNTGLQCIRRQCVPRCERAPDCGDGYSCDETGLCHAATGQLGDRCSSEVDCAAGLSCTINGAELDSNDRLQSSCTVVNPTKPAGAECTGNADCRNGTCALGHCVDLCQKDRDCASRESCVVIPSELANNAQFSGCLPTHGPIVWSIPVTHAQSEVLLPVPTRAQSAELVISVGDVTQKVGATSVLSPLGMRIYDRPCRPQTAANCTPTAAIDTYFTNAIRHQPAFGQSVLLIPTGPAVVIGGMYRVKVQSFTAVDGDGIDIPRVTAVVKLDSGVSLDLHFFFLDLGSHPCAELTDNATLDAKAAATAHYFQTDYLGALNGLLKAAGIELGAITYDVVERHDLDDLDLNAPNLTTTGDLLSYGKYATGINVFFVRSLSPLGVSAFSPSPGPAGVGGTRQSGIVLSLDTLCYRDWPAMARLTAHELARYMGLFHNVELDTARHPLWRDPFSDSDDSSNNLMYFSDLAGATATPAAELSPSQRLLLLRSAVLR